MISIEEYARVKGVSATTLHVPFWEDVKGNQTRTHKINRNTQIVTCYVTGYVTPDGIPLNNFNFQINEAEFNKLKARSVSIGAIPHMMKPFEQKESKDVDLLEDGKVRFHTRDKRPIE